MNRYHISFAGAGRVASSLCTALYRAGHSIDTVVSQRGESARRLASQCNAEWSSELIFPASSRIVMVSVPDARLPGVLEDIRYGSGTLIAHTAGSFGLEVFPETITDKGVLYPLQTFSPGRAIEFKGLPFLIESDRKSSEEILTGLASSIGGSSYYFDTKKRRLVHLAAVFVCNFTNFMLTSGKKITDQSGIDFKILEPLIRETVAKAIEEGPENAQTGPAFRNDKNTIEKHLNLLADSPELQRVYRTITESIMKYYNNDRG